MLLVLRIRATIRLYACEQWYSVILGGIDLPIETEDFAENEDEHHCDEDAVLVHECAHAL